jgi:hypothetical protein
MLYDEIMPKPSGFEAKDFIDVSEIWVQKRPQKGDHIRVKRIGGLYAHHGVYVSDNEVIHFTGQDDDSILDWSKCEVIMTDLAVFLKGGTLEVKEYTDEEFPDLYSPDQIVSYARCCIGDRGYNLAFNNCEHFANVCTLGRFRSHQVERVFSGLLPNKEDKKMGLRAAISGFISGLFGGGSSGGSRSTTQYEPDKVKVAEIEAETKLKLANKETERIEIMKQARLDILECETQCKLAIEKAKAEGMGLMAQMIVSLQEKLNEVAEKRLQIIENGSMQIVKDIESFYDEIGEKIRSDNDKYNREKLPALLDILQKYEKDTPQYEIYYQQIQDDRKIQQQYFMKQLDAVLVRQNMVTDSFTSDKRILLEQTSQITKGMLDSVQAQMLQLGTDVQTAALLTDKSEGIPALPDKTDN